MPKKKLSETSQKFRLKQINGYCHVLEDVWTKTGQLVCIHLIKLFKIFCTSFFRLNSYRYVRANLPGIVFFCGMFVFLLPIDPRRIFRSVDERTKMFHLFCFFENSRHADADSGERVLGVLTPTRTVE